MSHYDSECSFCGAFGQFMSLECSCEKAQLFRKEQLNQLKIRYLTCVKFLQSKNYPTTFDSWDQSSAKSNGIYEN